MTELPDGEAGRGRPAQRRRGAAACRPSGSTSATARRAALASRPSSATDLEHGFAGLAKFFVPGKAALAELEAELFRRLGAGTCSTTSTSPPAASSTS